MNDKSRESARMKWARFRFTIVGPLLSCPPDVGELREHVGALASRRWELPTTRESLRYGASTIERWYYAARNAKPDPIDALARKVPSARGHAPIARGRVAGGARRAVPRPPELDVRASPARTSRRWRRRTRR